MLLMMLSEYEPEYKFILQKAIDDFPFLYFLHRIYNLLHILMKDRERKE